MRTIRIPRNVDFPYFIDSSKTTYLVRQGVEIQTDDRYHDLFIQESEASRSNVIRIDGSLVLSNYDTALELAIDLMGSGTKLLIGRHGSIDGYTGVRLSGVDQTFINNGTLFGSILLGDAENLNDFQNNGKIRGTIHLGESTFELVLGKDSVLRWGGGTSYDAINRSAAAGIATTTINYGTITAPYVFESSSGNDTFINRGFLKGDVKLGDGNDMFQSTQRYFGIDIYGGEGDDTYIVSNPDTNVIEEIGGGNDIVKSRDDFFLGSHAEVETLMLIGKWGASLFGNSFDTHIIGNSGKNRLAGGGGSDTLEGGAGSDSFEMNEGYGHDIVTDFKAGEDRCNFVNWGALLDLEDVLEHATEINDGVLIEQGEDSIFLAGVALDQLTARDFIYGWPE